MWDWVPLVSGEAGRPWCGFHGAASRRRWCGRKVACFLGGCRSSGCTSHDLPIRPRQSFRLRGYVILLICVLIVPAEPFAVPEPLRWLPGSVPAPAAGQERERPSGQDGSPERRLVAARHISRICSIVRVSGQSPPCPDGCRVAGSHPESAYPAGPDIFRTCPGCNNDAARA